MSLHISYLLFIFSLIFAPLAFGSVELWSTALLEWSIMAATASLLFFRLHRRGKTFYPPPGLTPLVLFVFYLFLQTIPLPIIFLKFISPAAFDLKLNTTGIINPLSWSAISINRHATLIEFYRFAAYTCLYFLTTQLLTNKKYLFRTISIVVTLGTFIALEAILQRYTANRLIYWFRAVPSSAILPMGPYIYHNHFAGFMEMVCPLGIGLFLVTKAQNRVAPLTLRKKIVSFFNHPQNSIHLFFGAGACLMIVSIFISLSRGGILSICGAFIGYCLLLLRHKKSTTSKTYYWLLALIIFMTISWFGWDAIVERFFKIYTFNEGLQDGRLQVWRDTLAIIKDYWLTGSGFGSYLDLYPGYRSLASGKIFDHAHNDYLELISTGGLVSFALIVAFLWALVRKSLRALHTPQRDYSVYISYACLTGILSILLHSITDFNFYNSANGAYFFFLCGLLVSASHTCLSGAKNRHSLLKISKNPVFLPAALLCVLIVFGTGMHFNLGAIQAKNIYTKLQTINISTTPVDELGNLRSDALQMVSYDPLEAKYIFLAGNIELYAAEIDTAFNYFSKAVALNPANYEFVQRLGIVADSLGNKSGGESLLRKGLDLGPRSPTSYLQYGRWLIYNNRFDEALAAMKSSITERTKSMEDSLRLMAEANFPASMMQKAIPVNIRDQLNFCRYLAPLNNESATRMGYDRASQILLAAGDGTIKANYYEQVANYFIKNKAFNKALTILSHAANIYPNDTRISLRLGFTYNKKGETSNAEAAYTKAIASSPEAIAPYITFGSMLNNAGKDAAAKKIYETAYGLLAKNNDNRTWYYWTIAQYFEKNDAQLTAFKILQDGTKAFPEDVQMQIHLGRLCQKIGKRVRGENAFEKALDLMTQNQKKAAWHYRSIASYYTKNDPEKATKILLDGIKSFPDDPNLFVNLGRIYLQMGKMETAKQTVEKALELSPENKTAKRLLSQINLQE